MKPEERLIFTSALRADFRPAPPSDNGVIGMHFTAVIVMEALGANQTRYTAYALHGSPEHRAEHEAMGFEDGWGAALDQLVAICKTL